MGLDARACACQCVRGEHPRPTVHRDAEEQRDGARSVRLPAQRRPLTDEPGAVRARRHSAAPAVTTPAEQVHPEVAQVTRELGIDLTHHRPQLLMRELAGQANVV